MALLSTEDSIFHPLKIALANILLYSEDNIYYPQKIALANILLSTEDSIFYTVKDCIGYMLKDSILLSTEESRSVFILLQLFCFNSVT